MMGQMLAGDNSLRWFLVPEAMRCFGLLLQLYRRRVKAGPAYLPSSQLPLWPKVRAWLGHQTVQRRPLPRHGA